MNNKFLKIAVIVPAGRIDYLTGTIIDGLIQFKDEGFLDFQVNAGEHDWRNFSIKPFELSRKDFIEYARISDNIIFCNGKDGTDHRLARNIGCWDKTVFIDSSELGRNRRYDHEMQKKSLNPKRNKYGFIDARAYKKCALYFRREKPYLPGIRPLPFGIERKINSSYNKEIVKDIDFCCIFGQDEFPE